MDFASALLSFLAGASVRSLLLALPPLAVLAVLQRAGWVRSAAARHAVLFLVAGGMIGMAALNPLLPAIPVRILAAPAAATPIQAITASPALLNEAPPAAIPAPPPAAPSRLTLAVALDALYFAGLALALARLLFCALFTRRLVRAAVPVEGDLGPDVFESSWIAVPLTVGWLRPRVLLPAGWHEWEAAKLEAVLAHERNHIGRGDWAIALTAAFNRSLYWFNPLAWWLERRLATLAEQACDDAALLSLGRRESYAQALLDMAAAVKTGNGRLVWEAMAMAKGAEVRMRIERILDDNRPIPRGLTRSRWMALVACILPLIYLAAALQPAPAQSREQPIPQAIADLLKAPAPMTPSGAAQLEQYLTSSPNDLQARVQLILYYFSAGVREPRLNHTYWMIANHPENKLTAIASQGIAARASAFNTTADYEHAAELWRQQAASHSGDEAVLVNAARFFGQPGGDPNEAERLLLQTNALRPGAGAAADELAKLYATAILGTSGDPKFPNDNPNFANRVRAEIENLQDARLMLLTGMDLDQAARLPRTGETLPAGTLNLSEHPLLMPIHELAGRLTAQAPKLPGASGTLLGVRSGVLSGQVAAREPGQPPQPTASSAAEANPGVPVISPAPAPISRVEPAYPPLARQARIQGIVDLAVVITPDGHVTNIRVLRGHPLLVQPSLDAVKQWVYPPVAQAGTFEQRVTFTLPPGEAPPSQAMAQAAPQFQSSATGGQGQPPVPQRIRVGGNVQAAMLIKHADPEYPALARQAGIQGKVTLDVVIGKDGSVENISPVEGHPLLVGAAQDAVKQWQYRPTLLNGQPVEVQTTVTVPFELNP